MAKRKPRKALKNRKNIDARRVRFVQEYLIDFNGTQAAIRAGYSAKSAQVTASRLLNDAMVGGQIETAKVELAERHRLKLDDVVQELRRIGFANMAHYSRLIEGGRVPDLSSATDEQMAVVSSLDVEEDIITTKDGRAADRVEGDDGYGEEGITVLRRRTRFKLHDKVNALVQLGRHLGGFGATLNVHQTVNLNVSAAGDELRKLPIAAVEAIIDGIYEVVEGRSDEGETAGESDQG